MTSMRSMHSAVPTRLQHPRQDKRLRLSGRRLVYSVSLLNTHISQGDCGTLPQEGIFEACRLTVLARFDEIGMNEVG
jgi:hypothetical protein